METSKQSPDRKLERATPGQVLQYGNALAAALPIAITHHGEHPLVALPPGYNVEDLEKFLPTRARRRGNIQLASLQSFCCHVTEFQTEETQVFFTTKGELRAIFNYGRPGHPSGWRDDLAVFTPVLANEFSKWKAIDRRLLTQTEAAEFIQDRQIHIMDPVGAEILEIVRTLSATKKVNFVSGVRLDNGDTQFIYEETTESRAGQKGEFKVPSEIQVYLPVFEHCPGVDLRVLLRYQIREGVLKFQFCIAGVEAVEEQAIQNLLKEACEKLGYAPLIVQH